MSEVKQVKVDNWGIYFLQKLKHFFNRTDYCDLTLQFQNNAQLKVHRLVLNACTEYFELLERTCEMYEDCLVMPDDLQADVVVPIVNFMYTGHLEFRQDLLERLYQTSQILNMPVLTKLLESHRMAVKTNSHSYSATKRFPKPSETNKLMKPTVSSNKRSYSKAFENNVQSREKKFYNTHKNIDSDTRPSTYRAPSPVPVVPAEPVIPNIRTALSDPKPTRYELPEELDQDNIFDNSFCSISYACKPLMVHPDNVKRYSAKKSGIFSEASGSKKMLSTMDVVECKRISKESNIFDDNISDHVNDDLDIFQTSYNNETVKNTSHLFDQILDDSPKVTIDAKDSKAAANLDHAKIISEVLKKYPHLVKSNKNIKLKILSTPNKTKKLPQKTSAYVEEKQKHKSEEPDYTYETDVIDSQQAAKLIAMGAENIKGPWICLICGTPGKALHFSSYYKFRRHLVEVHKEKPVSNICEYCGLKSLKRNNLLHHLYSQHGQPPPPPYKFPKCNRCSYIALTEGLLIKHKMSHREIKNFRCNVCSSEFATTKQLLQHIQATGHKYSAERKTNLQCIYCSKSFLRDGNLYAHLKTYHKKEAKCDGVIEDSDDEKPTVEIPRPKMNNREAKYQTIKCEPSTSSYENEYEVDVQYQIQQGQDGDIQLTPTKHTQHRVNTNLKQKILNPGFGTPKSIIQKGKPVMNNQPEPSPFLDEISIPLSPVTNDHSNDEEIVLIDNTEYIMRDNQLIPRKLKSGSNEYIISDMMESASLQQVQPTTSSEYTNIHNTNIIEETASRMLVKKATNINQPIQIVVSNEEEYKALMASNHPILFDHGDASKTLTVLTAQHNPTMQSTSIDLNTTPSNNMMIIQEDYPINVSEGISTDNSNIVVVYSHPVDDPNKQYQILTTGGIGSQFVESSAIITQNYETVSTSTPVTSVHALQPQVDTMWQSSVQHINNQGVPVESHAELQNVIEGAEIVQTRNVTDESLSELPEVHLLSDQDANQVQVPIPHENQVDASNEINSINSELTGQSEEQDILEEPQNIPNSQIETHMPNTQIKTHILRGDIVGEESTDIPKPMDISHENEAISDSLTNSANQNTIIHLPIENIVAAEDVAVTEKHIEIGEGPVETAERSVETAEEPIETAGGPVETAEEPVETAEGPVQTAEEPAQSAEEHTQNSNEQTEATEEYTQPAGITKFVSEEQVDDGIATEITEAVEDGNNVDQSLPESQAYDDIVQNDIESKGTPPYAKETDEKIQNLTSEWSEDEYDISEDATNESISKPKDVTPPVPEQLEETIENIRKEMQNHITTASTVTATSEPELDTEIDSKGDSILVDTLTGQISEQAEAAIPVAVEENEQAQEKISSLLNDWNDNDSQDNNSGDVPAIENEQVSDIPVTENEPLSDVTIEKISKIDNIKNLVSDWEEEEEIKTNNE